MPNLSILNTLIAMVIVILVLSLIVQSLQTLVKKFLKLKSRTLLNSLEDLFETITQNPGETPAPVKTGGKTPQRQLVDEVAAKFGEMGRKTLIFRKPMLDSIAKGDLLKVLTRVEANNLLPGAVDKFQAVLDAVNKLNGVLDEIAKHSQFFAGNESAKFAALRASVLPLVDDVQALVTGSNINPKVLLGDLYRLRQIKVADVLGILGEIQQKVGEDLDEAGAADAAAQKALRDAESGGVPAQVEEARGRTAAAAGKLEGVRAVSDGLKNVAVEITALGKAFDAAFAPLRERLQQAEVWYDTVMQGFSERYARHMRTVALIISILVVMLLNANFFSIYRALAADPVKTAALADRAGDIIEQSRRVTSEQGGAAPGQAAGATASPAPAEAPATVEDLKKQGEEVNQLVGTYKSFGIEPLTWRQFYNGLTFNAPAGAIFETVIGWAIMVMLLSAGAPFWQDTLESLFGLKNLLRQKSDTKNVEGEKGGQPKP
ncbi:MAG TPA: hypothetical protein VF659_12255 [Pyrinomonadaceae bacterium]|jgi:hypothetical protein